MLKASVPTDGQVLTYDASSPSGWVATDPGHIVEVNDLSASVTWGSIEVPNANITSSSVTQHEGTINHDALLNYVSDEHIDWSVDQTIGSPDKKIHSSNIDFPDDIDHDSVTLVTTVSPSFISLSDQELTVGLVDPLVDIDITGTPDGTKFLKDDGSWATPVDIDHDEVTLEPGSPALDYLTIVGQVITLNEIDLATDVTGILDPSNLPGDLGATTLNELTDVNATATDGQVLTYSESSPSGWIASDTAEVHDAVTLTSTQSPALSYITLSGSPSEQELVLDLIDLNIDVTGLLSLTNVNISGTPDGTKFLRDDGTWAGIPGGISTLDGLDDVDAGVPSDGHVLTYSSSSPTGWVATDPGHIVEVNDLSSVVTWADVPDANITSSSVTQHEALINHDALLNYVADEHIDWTADQTIGSPDKKIHSSNIDFPADIDHDAVTLVTTVSPSFITLSDQELTVDQVDLTTDVTGLLPIAEVSIGGSVTGSNFLGDDGTWQSIPEAGASALSELTDVDFGSPGPADGQVLTYDASSPSGWVAADPGVLSEINDLNASVTWADVPDANITSSSVTQHSTALEGVLNHDNLVGFNADEHIDWTADQTIGSPDKKIHSSNIDFPADIDHDEVTLNGGSPLLDYLTLSGQEITLNQVDLSTDVTGILDPSNLPGDLGASTLDELTDVDFGSPGPLDGQVLTYSSSSPTGWISQSLPENGVKDVIVQTNTFEVGDAVYDNAGTWELADASSGNTAETLGLVGDATSTEFTLVTHGRIEGIARSPALIPNQMYFLSDTNPGELTDEEPITNGSISKPMLWTDSSTSGYILNYRGIIVNIVDAPTDTLSSLNDVDFGSPGPTNGQVLTYSDSSPSGWVAADPGALSEINDLSSSVTWVNVPDANITSSSVTQHEALINHDSLLNFEPNEHIDWTVDQSAVSPVVSIHPSNLPEDIDHDEVTLNGGSPLLDYLTLSGQEITLNQVDLSTDVTGLLPIAEVSIGGSVTGSNFLGDDGTWQSIPEAGASALSELTDVDFGSPGPADGQVLTYSDSSPSGWVAAPLLTYGTVQGTGVNTYNIRAADSDGEGYGIGDARGEYSVDLQTHRYEPSRVASGFYCTIGGGSR